MKSFSVKKMFEEIEKREEEISKQLRKQFDEACILWPVGKKVKVISGFEHKGEIAPIEEARIANCGVVIREYKVFGRWYSEDALALIQTYVVTFKHNPYTELLLGSGGYWYVDAISEQAAIDRVSSHFWEPMREQCKQELIAYLQSEAHLLQAVIVGDEIRYLPVHTDQGCFFVVMNGIHCQLQFDQEQKRWKVPDLKKVMVLIESL